jgi:hypothetical protein
MLCIEVSKLSKIVVIGLINVRDLEIECLLNQSIDMDVTEFDLCRIIRLLLVEKGRTFYYCLNVLSNSYLLSIIIIIIIIIIFQFFFRFSYQILNNKKI